MVVLGLFEREAFSMTGVFVDTPCTFVMRRFESCGDDGVFVFSGMRESVGYKTNYLVEFREPKYGRRGTEDGGRPKGCLFGSEGHTLIMIW